MYHIAIIFSSLLLATPILADSVSLIDRLEERLQQLEKLDENNENENEIQSRSAMLTKLIKMLDINGYGCWCNFDMPSPNNQNSETKRINYGEPIDEFDQFCQTLHLGYECATFDAVASQSDCVPWKVNYRFTSYKRDILTECTQRNQGNDCAINSCIIELSFITSIMKKYKSQELPTESHKHKNGFRKDIMCRQSGKMILTKSYTEIMKDLDFETMSMEEIQRLEQYLNENLDYDSYEDNEHLSTQIVDDPIGFLGSTFDKNSESETTTGEQNLVKKTNFDSINDLIKSLPNEFRKPFMTKNTLTSRSNYAEATIIENKSCCGSYPNRRPYRPADLKSGEVKFCCGQSTYNPSRLQCCEGNHLQKFCSDGEVGYALN